MLQRASALAYIFRGDTINAPLVSYPRQNAQPPPSHTLFGRPRRLLNSRVAVMLSRALTTAFRRPCSTQTLRTTLRTRTQHIHTPTCSCVRPTLSTFRASLTTIELWNPGPRLRLQWPEHGWTDTNARHEGAEFGQEAV
jgi:hypothetical protein